MEILGGKFGEMWKIVWEKYRVFNLQCTVYYINCIGFQRNKRVYYYLK